jgi:thymidine kinase
MKNSARGSARAGSIEVIAGSMFSGKTEELMRLIKRAQFARRNIQVFKPKIDDRYSKDQVASHDRNMTPAIVIQKSIEIYEHLEPKTEVVAIDEGQFFDEEIVDVCNELADRGLRVLVAGLDTNYKGEPFHPMPSLMAIAEVVHKLRAVCVVCGEAALRTQRLVEDKSEVLVGDCMSYEPRCRTCFEAPDLSPSISFTFSNKSMGATDDISVEPAGAQIRT